MFFRFGFHNGSPSGEETVETGDPDDMGVSTVIKDYGTDILNAIRESDLQKLQSILDKHLKYDRKIQKLCTADIKHKPSKKFACPLILAARQEDPRIIKYMLDKGTDPNFVHHTIFSSKRKEVVTCLHIGVDLGHLDTVEALLSVNADANIKDHNGETPLHIAVKKADTVMTRMLLSRGADPAVVDRRGNAALHIATQYGHLQLVRLLLKYDADVYQKGHSGAIPPHIAAKEGHIHLIQLFCSRDVGNINIKIPCYPDKRAKAPIHLAAENGHVETVLALLDQFDAEVNLKDSDGNTPLHCVVINQYNPHRMRDKEYFNETARVLLKYKVYINEQNIWGDTPLHLAAANQYQRIAELLLEVGANPVITNNEQLKPIDIVPDSDTVMKQIIKNAMLNPRSTLSMSSDTLRSNKGTLSNTPDIKISRVRDGTMRTNNSSSSGDVKAANNLDDTMNSNLSLNSVFDDNKPPLRGSSTQTQIPMYATTGSVTDRITTNTATGTDHRRVSSIGTGTDRRKVSHAGTGTDDMYIDQRDIQTSTERQDTALYSQVNKKMKKSQSDHQQQVPANSKNVKTAVVNQGQGQSMVKALHSDGMPDHDTAAVNSSLHRKPSHSSAVTEEDVYVPIGHQPGQEKPQQKHRSYKIASSSTRSASRERINSDYDSEEHQREAVYQNVDNHQQMHEKSQRRPRSYRIASSTTRSASRERINSDYDSEEAIYQNAEVMQDSNQQKATHKQRKPSIESNAYKVSGADEGNAEEPQRGRSRHRQNQQQQPAEYTKEDIQSGLKHAESQEGRQEENKTITIVKKSVDKDGYETEIVTETIEGPNGETHTITKTTRRFVQPPKEAETPKQSKSSTKKVKKHPPGFVITNALEDEQFNEEGEFSPEEMSPNASIAYRKGFGFANGRYKPGIISTPEVSKWNVKPGVATTVENSAEHVEDNRHQVSEGQVTEIMGDAATGYIVTVKSKQGAVEEQESSDSLEETVLIKASTHPQEDHDQFYRLTPDRLDQQESTSSSSAPEQDVTQIHIIPPEDAQNPGRAQTGSKETSIDEDDEFLIEPLRQSPGARPHPHRLSDVPEEVAEILEREAAERKAMYPSKQAHQLTITVPEEPAGSQTPDSMLSKSQDSLLSPNTSFSDAESPRPYGLNMRVTGEVPKAYKHSTKNKARKDFIKAAPQGIESGSEASDSESIHGVNTPTKRTRWIEPIVPIYDKPRTNSDSDNASTTDPSKTATMDKIKKQGVKLFGPLPKPYKSFGVIETKTDALEEALMEAAAASDNEFSEQNRRWGSQSSNLSYSAGIKQFQSAPPENQANVIVPKVQSAIPDPKLVENIENEDTSENGSDDDIEAYSERPATVIKAEPDKSEQIVKPIDMTTNIPKSQSSTIAQQMSPQPPTAKEAEAVIGEALTKPRTQSGIETLLAGLGPEARKQILRAQAEQLEEAEKMRGHENSSTQKATKSTEAAQPDPDDDLEVAGIIAAADDRRAKRKQEKDLQKQMQQQLAKAAMTQQHQATNITSSAQHSTVGDIVDPNVTSSLETTKEVHSTSQHSLGASEAVMASTEDLQHTGSETPNSKRKGGLFNLKKKKDKHKGSTESLTKSIGNDSPRSSPMSTPKQQKKSLFGTKKPPPLTTDLTSSAVTSQTWQEASAGMPVAMSNTAQVHSGITAGGQPQMAYPQVGETPDDHNIHSTIMGSEYDQSNTVKKKGGFFNIGSKRKKKSEYKDNQQPAQANPNMTAQPGPVPKSVPSDSVAKPPQLGSSVPNPIKSHYGAQPLGDAQLASQLWAEQANASNQSQGKARETSIDDHLHPAQQTLNTSQHRSPQKQQHGRQASTETNIDDPYVQNSSFQNAAMAAITGNIPKPQTSVKSKQSATPNSDNQFQPIHIPSNNSQQNQKAKHYDDSQLASQLFMQSKVKPQNQQIKDEDAIAVGTGQVVAAVPTEEAAISGARPRNAKKVKIKERTEDDDAPVMANAQSFHAAALASVTANLSGSTANNKTVHKPETEKKVPSSIIRPQAVNANVPIAKGRVDDSHLAAQLWSEQRGYQPGENSDEDENSMASNIIQADVLIHKPPTAHSDQKQRPDDIKQDNVYAKQTTQSSEGFKNYPTKPLQDAAMESIVAGIQYQQPIRKAVKPTSQSHSDQYHRPSHYNNSSQGGSSRYGDSQLASQLWSQQQSKHATTDSEGEADTEDLPMDTSMDSSVFEKSDLGFHRTPKSSSSALQPPTSKPLTSTPEEAQTQSSRNQIQTDEPHAFHAVRKDPARQIRPPATMATPPSGFLPIETSLTSGGRQRSQSPTGSTTTASIDLDHRRPRGRRKNRRPKDEAPKTDTAPVNLDKFNIASQLWMEQVDRNNYQKSKRMGLSVVPADQAMPDELLQNMPQRSRAEATDEIAPQWVIARGLTKKNRKPHFQLPDMNGSQSFRDRYLSSATSDSELDISSSRPMSPGRQLLLFFRIGSNWRDLAWILFEDVQKDAETLKMIKDIQMQHPNQLTNQVNDMMHRWWRRRGNDATIEELQRALDMIQLGYIREEFYDASSKITSYVTSDSELDMGEISDADPDVKRLLDEYEFKSMNATFDYDSGTESRMRYSSDNLSRSGRGSRPSSRNSGRFKFSSSRESLDEAFGERTRKSSFVIVQPQLSNPDVSFLYFI